MVQPDKRPRRFFISYRRRTEPDAALAESLRSGLEAAGCEVFIDVAMPVGIDWSAEIERRIDWCDHLVVLLSAESVTSQMVQGEVRRAHARSGALGRNLILPVRVAYEGSLGYELDSYLSTLQYALWRGADDNKQLLSEILRGALSAHPVLRRPILALNCQPEVKADMRLLRQSLEAPGSPLAADNPRYVLRPADLRIAELAAGRPRTLVISGPPRSGKSSSLLRYMAASQGAGNRVALIDLSLLGHLAARQFGDFAAKFVELMSLELEIVVNDIPEFRFALDLTRFIEDRVLKEINCGVLLAIDDADRIIGCSWQEEFFSALRGWDAKRARPGRDRGWDRLGLALAITTHAKALIEEGFTSPFNVGEQVRLRGFERTDLDTLNANHHYVLNQGELDRLYSLLRGDAYLTVLAFYRLAEGLSFESLCSDAPKDSGPFGDHLRATLLALYGGGLDDAMREVLRCGAVPGKDRRLFFRLETAGLVREEDGRIIPSLELYQRFFEAVL